MTELSDDGVLLLSTTEDDFFAGLVGSWRTPAAAGPGLFVEGKAAAFLRSSHAEGSDASGRRHSSKTSVRRAREGLERGSSGLIPARKLPGGDTPSSSTISPLSLFLLLLLGEHRWGDTALTLLLGLAAALLGGRAELRLLLLVLVMWWQRSLSFSDEASGVPLRASW
jgi:hypothetical protein